MTVETLTAYCILAAWLVVAYRVALLDLKRTRPAVIFQHLVVGIALAAALIAPGAWGKLALSFGVLLMFLASTHRWPGAAPEGTRRPATVQFHFTSDDPRAAERVQAAARSAIRATSNRGN